MIAGAMSYGHGGGAECVRADRRGSGFADDPEAMTFYGQAAAEKTAVISATDFSRA